MNENLKRRLLRETVDENVALIQGIKRPPPTPARRRARVVQWTLALLVPTALGASLFLLRPDAYAVLAQLDVDVPVTIAALSPSPASATEPTAGVESAGAEFAVELPTRLALRPPSRWALEPAPLDPGDAPQRIDTTALPLQVRHIVLDPGHGGEDWGTRNGELSEKELTLDIAQRLRTLLEIDGFQVSMTREDDLALLLRDRSDFANRVAADLFVSIHINWIASRERGVETYFLGPTEDPALNDLARRENRNSGYSLGDQNNLIRSIVRNAQHERSQHLASNIQSSLHRSLLDVNPELTDRGVKTAPFVVLVATEMPAILAEVSCLSNAEEAELLARPLYREHIAKALFDGIRGYARDVSSAESKEREGP